MAQILYLHTLRPEEAERRAKVYQIGLQAGSIQCFTSLSDLISYVSVAGNSDLDLDYPTPVIVSDGIGKESGLNGLKLNQVRTLLEIHYKHMNIIVYEESSLSCTNAREEIERYHSLLKNRLVRMKTWAGLNNELANDCPRLYTMANALHSMLNTTEQLTNELRRYILMTNQSINFFHLLDLERPLEVYQQCVGNWGFIAHELSCDESTVCAFLIFKHAFESLPENSPLVIDNNALLGFLFSVRDSYRGGNAFHNFRHAVDVLQGTFYLLIRLGSLPPFKGYTTEIQGVRSPDILPKDSLLSPEQVLSLLLASIGHDVGHPGLTNDFLSKFQAPMAAVFSSRSVLENFHSAWFQRVLKLHWPIFLESPWIKLQTETILATDMASHFEYVSKMKEMLHYLKISEHREQFKNDQKSTLILMSLIIKCADISNVTRPLDISARWGVVLTREFGEIMQLTDHLTKGTDIQSIKDRREEPSFPMTFAEALKDTEKLPQNQLFFISNYADSMFKEVANLLPELSFLYEVLIYNTEAWNRAKR
jgi:3',5'-cyclic-nucleotide phosphodiesterase